METVVVAIRKEEDAESIGQKLAAAGGIIKRGGLVAFPTETVYGLGGDALDPESSRKIYAAKGRPSDNPLIVHIADMDALWAVAAEVPEKAKKLADAFWPGPLTMIFHKAGCVPAQTTGGLGTVAVRMPSHPVAQSFIRHAGGYVAAPSANLSGRPSPTSARYVLQDMMGRIDMIIDADGAEIGLESTIVDMTCDVPMVLRPGFITQRMLSEVIGETDMDVAVYEDASVQTPRAPGMKYRHYAPRGELVIVEGGAQEVVRYINAQAAAHREKGERTGIIGSQEHIAQYRADSIKNAGRRDDPCEAAKRLYTFLREFDDEGIGYMYAEAFERKGFGQAVMNRLLKAAGHRVVRV